MRQERPASRRWAHDHQLSSGHRTDTGTSGTPPAPVGTRTTPAWVGVVWFAGAMAMTSGAANVIDGLIAVYDDEHHAVTGSGQLLVWDYTVWGWVHLLVGLGLFALGVLLVTRPTPAVRVTTAVLAGVNIVAQLAYLSVYPVYSIAVAALDVLVIYGLLAHGRDIEESLS
ncbi:DUF7144 family membrane protein [Geodermatophilus sp. SYSU D00710]